MDDASAGLALGLALVDGEDRVACLVESRINLAI